MKIKSGYKLSKFKSEASCHKSFKMDFLLSVNENGPLTIHIERDSHGPVPKFILCCTGVDP